MSHSAIPSSPTSDAWDRLFAAAEDAHASLVKDWYGREALYRAHDRLHVLFSHLEPSAVGESVLVQRLVEDGTDGEQVLRLWTAWKKLHPDKTDQQFVLVA